MANKNFVSTGSALLNLGLTGHTRKGLQEGTYALFVGDSNSGKTVLSLAILAEASINPAFDDHKLIYDGPEYGALMNIGQMYGKKLEDRLEFRIPGEGASTTAEEYYDSTDDELKEGPIIKILDSMDALTSDQDVEQIEKEKDARRSNKDVKGSYGTGKPSTNSKRLRLCINKAAKNRSILVIISQTRDNIGFTAMFNPKTRAGGNALTFYAHTEVWLSRKERLTVPYKGKKVETGGISLFRIKRTRHTGWRTEVEVPIYHSIGIDDIGSMVSFLLEWKHWRKVKGNVKASEFDWIGKEEKLCQKIDSEGLKPKLRKIVAGVWKILKARATIHRSSPYGGD